MTESGHTAAFDAPAKINLYLHVVGRRADGFHLLDSLVAFAGIGDSVFAKTATELRLVRQGPFACRVPAAEDNLVMQAARRLAAAAGVAAVAEVTLVKRLPVAAGVGGGSADAAAALRALAALWGVDAKEEMLAAIGIGLGADVPVCLAGRAAFVGGAGEQLTPAPALPPAWLVLANAGTSLPTPAVFAARSHDFSAPARFGEAPADTRALVALLEARRNDLTQPACGLAPVIGDTLAALQAQPGALLVRMSGSGATCFALFAGAGEATAAAGRLAADRPDWWVVAAPLVGGPADQGDRRHLAGRRV